MHIFYVDAQYVLNGIKAQSNLHIGGLNGDLWSLFYYALKPFEDFV